MTVPAQPAATPRPRLGAVVVTCNRLHQIRQTVARLLDSPVDRLIVVDNASSDGTDTFLAGVNDPRLEVIRSDRNIGGAGGFALAIRSMTERHDPDWLLVTDDDSRPEPGALEAFLNTDLTGYDAVAGAAYYPDGAICGMNRPFLNPFSHPRVLFRTLIGGGRAAFHLKDTHYRGTEPVAVDGASFVGLLMSRKAIGMAGLPRAELFLYAEDGLYTLGLTQQGGRIAFLPQLRFEHDCSTFALGSGRFTPMWKSYYYHRNLLLLYRQAAGAYFWPALVLFVLPKWLLKARRQGDQWAVYLRLLRHAVGDGLARRFDRPLTEILTIAPPPR